MYNGWLPAGIFLLESVKMTVKVEILLPSQGDGKNEGILVQKILS